ncbi:MAG: response regulator [Ideonella sp.]|nr:response regulator [Ideonella sp.]
MSLRVLVVDDDVPGLILAESVLARLRVEVVPARDGSECVAAFRMQRFDAVFMDHLMPSMSGLDATDQIRRIERERGARRTPIIALTACALRAEIDDFLRAGADDVLLKPYRIEDLAAMLEKWV